MDYDSDVSDVYADFSDEILEEIKEESWLKSINSFKNLICKEPEFTGIENISSYEILNILLNKNVKPNKLNNISCISEYQTELFEDLTNSLFNKIYNKSYYNQISIYIFEKIYI